MNQKSKFIKDCKKIFPFYTKKEKNYLRKLACSISDSSYDSIVDQFGTPKEIMLSYFHNCDDEYVLKQSNIKTALRSFCIIIISILIISISILAYCEYQTIQRYKEREYIIIEETITEE